MAGRCARRLPVKQLELFYAPYVDNLASFDAQRQYLTLDVHFDATLLEPFARDFPLLGRFLEKVHRGEPAKLFDSPQVASPRINAVLTSILRYSFVDQLAPRYYDAQVNILLILFLERIAGAAWRRRSCRAVGSRLPKRRSAC